MRPPLETGSRSDPRSNLWDKLIRLRREGRLRLALEGEVGNWLSALGERLGWQNLVFNRFTFSMYHRGALDTAPSAVTCLLSLYPALRIVVDLGCGTGVYLHEFEVRGVETIGYEHSARARRQAERLYGLKVRPFDVQEFKGVGRLADACLCIEVAHYLPPSLANLLVQHCARSAPLVIFSAAQPGQGGYGHVNAQPREYWIERFAALGYRLNVSTSSRLQDHLRTHLKRGFWLAANVCLFERI